MSMVTSCPSCTTTFRVTTDQLKAREGKVRCGQCLVVFDAFKSLASVRDGPVHAPAPAEISTALSNEERAATETLDFELAPTVATAAGASPMLDLALPEPHAEPSTIELPAAAAAARPRTAPESPPPRAQLATSPTTPVRPAQAQASERKPRRRFLWLLIAFALLIGVLLQGFYLYRAELAAALPEMKPWLQSLCATVGCSLDPPKRAEALIIDSSDLQTEPGRPNLIVLTATLRNRGAAPVAYPALELTLTNAQNQTVARRVIAPADYLDRRAEVTAGMPPQAEVNVRLELDTGELRPTGYQLKLFYP